MAANYTSVDCVESWVTGHHIYKKIWTPVIGEVLSCKRERGNPTDIWAVGVFKHQKLVGHVPRELANRFSLALRDGASITARITGKRENKRRRGLEVPVTYQIDTNTS